MVAQLSSSFDIVIEKGMILDGTGSPMSPGDVGILAGHIRGIGDLRGVAAVRRIDASGLVVAPGFIDIHTHADERIEQIPLAQNYLRQGVTTIVGGQCGESIYPIGERLASLEKVDLAINFALMVGHSTLRKKVVGKGDRTPTAGEMQEMKARMAEAMEQGALGLSTGLYYAPGSYSTTEEIVELARVAARYGRVYASHIRDEGDFNMGLMNAVREAIEIGMTAEVPVQISHLKALGREVWGRSIEILDLIDKARASGIDVTFDQYPYVASETSLVGAVVPRWAQAGGRSGLRHVLLESSFREKIRNEMDLAIEKRGGPDSLIVARFNPDRALEGKSLEEIGTMVRKSPADAAIDILLAGEAEVISFNMSEEDLIQIMKSPVGMVASDSGVAEEGERVHPRYYGTFPRILGRYVREKRFLTLEEAIRKMTSAPASRLGLSDRGVIKKGKVADITIFNPGTIMDRADFENPSQSPQGIEYVIVNGRLAISERKWTGCRAGKVLYGMTRNA